MPGKLTASELREFLSLPEIGVLCTVDAQGRPEGSPVWFEYNDEKIYIHVDGTSKKARNVAANPHVSLTLDTRVAPYKGAILHGTVRMLPPDDGIRRSTAHHYLGADMGDAYLEMTADGFDSTVLLEMTITSRFTWDYAKSLV
ncbi:MAG TPA: pyridoxamine 5'-phosphate oxidase family protein [Candidatus Limnocylindrales bacterium]|nr:pyridoxamine 5'-phosphate oxidase family protein [Candidatus Limnocylindrales bacterium]